MDWMKAFIVLMSASSVTNVTEKDGLEVLLLWHTSTGQDAAFFQGRGFLVHFIDGLAEGTNVIVKTINADANIDDIQFQKESANYTWRDKIMLHMPCNTGNHVISSNDVSEAVFKYFDQNKKQKRAEEVFLIVTNKSVIDNEGRVKEALRKKKTFVVVYGNQTDRNVWADLATDNYHLKELQDDILNSTIKSLRKLSCKDSNNYIQDTDLGVTTPASDQINLKTIHESVTRNTSLIYVVIFLLVLLVGCLGPKFIKKARTIFEKVVCKKGNVQNALELAKPRNHIRDSMPQQPVENDNTNHTRDSIAYQSVENDNNENECNTELPERRRNNPSPAEYGSESFISIQAFGVTRQDIPDPTEITPGVNPETRALI